MTTILEAKLPKLSTADEYGESIDNMEPNNQNPLTIPEDHRQKVLHFVRRKYGSARIYITRTIDSELKLYRLK